LENILQQATGFDRKHSYGKILIIVEGVYSMEGDLPPLREIVELKQKYHAYLWLDEAHSIGAVGPTGRGVCEQLNVHPSNVDICMGTFTKSFGSVGGYVASSTELIDALKQSTAAHVHSASLAPAACAQVLHALQTLNTPAGRERIQTLQTNSRYFRRRLVDMGLLVLGDDCSPVIPVLLGLPTKISAFSRLCLQHHLAVVVVGYPATPLMLPRARFCISAAHTKEDLDFALGVLETLSDRCHLRYNRKIFG
jgi:serine palmitoyltransferase